MDGVMLFRIHETRTTWDEEENFDLCPWPGAYLDPEHQPVLYPDTGFNRRNWLIELLDLEALMTIVAEEHVVIYFDAYDNPRKIPTIEIYNDYRE